MGGVIAERLSVRVIIVQAWRQNVVTRPHLSSWRVEGGSGFKSRISQH